MARVDVAALRADTIRVQLFDDLVLTMRRARMDRIARGKFVWVGADRAGAQSVLSVVDDVLTGTVYADHRTFEIMVAPDGQYTVTELDSGAFPSDDPPDAPQPDGVDPPDAGVADQAALTQEPGGTVSADAPLSTQIDVMIVWTPAAETAGGGRTAMNSLAQAAVANANLAYANSLVGARLRLVYAAPISFVESPSNLSGDLNALRGTSDGKMDQVHTIRNTYGADIVTLIGHGYAGAGYCGIGGLMTTVSTSFANSAFNVVDRTCAVGNLSYAHEVGHNQGLQHDPANAGSTASTPYAYGYQDPAGLFRTVLSYGGALRVPYLSNPNVLYSSRPTGTSSQDNARALNANAATVGAFRAAVTGATTCSYALSHTTLAFTASSGSQSVAVTAPAGCTWAASHSASWITLGSGSGSGNGSVTVSVAANTGSSRNATMTVAGHTLTVTQAASVTTTSPGDINVAAAAHGARASASSSLYSPAGAINGDRMGLDWGTSTGGWRDSTRGTFPDWLRVDFAGARIINEVRVFTLQDDSAAPVEPTATMTFTRYGVTSFAVQYWTGTQWQTVSNGTVTGNRNVWRTVAFTAVTTAAIRIVVNGSIDNLSSRIVEVEAYGTEALAITGTNVAAASAGARAMASTSLYAPAGTINGDRRGLNWGTTGGWRDDTPGTFPDWLQVDFAGARTIGEVAVFSVQDAYRTPIEPTATMTFSKYGVTAFTVQYWSGTSWLSVPGATVTGNRHVWRTVTFSPITTSAIRVVVNGTIDGTSRIVEVEAR